jgi:hypothetical protein
MALIHLPVPAREVGPGVIRQAVRMVAPIVLLVAAAWTMALVGGRIVERLEDTAGDGAAAQVGPPEVINPGNGPSVAATARSRIVSTECWLSGPIDVAAEGTGAYVVTGHADRVHCPDGQFEEGFTLRWPAQHQPGTRPA